MDETYLQSLFRAHVSVKMLAVADHSETLFPDEQSLLQNVASKRREEFSTGRFCARKALETLKLHPEPILPGERREPLWPKGVTGSISHTGGCCLAAVSRDRRLLSLGLDVEKREPIETGVRDRVCLPEELRKLGPYRDEPEIWTLIFSAKESVYKSLYPLVRQWIGFSQASLRFDFVNAGFSVEMDKSLNIAPEILQNLRGRFVFSDDFIFTCVEIASPDKT
ncbi:MAG: 4'-phosphopantetheinyl transferase superfamily protein [Gammaproteobacteria bacterium]|nr:4'-phosphopantetheinyl transferase superfamily protein [Gammaproteobacteria bacterium]